MHGDKSSDSPAADKPDVRPARQERSRRSWDRALVAGASILEESGIDGFTIAAVCQRASISVASIYSRVDGKDGLLLAVYDHAMRSIDSRKSQPMSAEMWESVPATLAVEQAVRSVADVFLDQPGLMRTIILLSGSYNEIRRKGSAWTTKIGQQFAAALTLHPDIAGIADLDRKLDLAFRLVVSTTVIHIAYGDRFASDTNLSDDDLVRHLQFVTRATVLGSVG